MCNKTNSFGTLYAVAHRTAICTLLTNRTSLLRIRFRRFDCAFASDDHISSVRCEKDRIQMNQNAGEPKPRTFSRNAGTSGRSCLECWRLECERRPSAPALPANTTVPAAGCALRDRFPLPAERLSHFHYAARARQSIAARGSERVPAAIPPKFESRSPAQRRARSYFRVPERCPASRKLPAIALLPARSPQLSFPSTSPDGRGTLAPTGEYLRVSRAAAAGVSG